MQANIVKTLDELESCHHRLKSEYLQWAKGKLQNNGIGAEYNAETLKVLGKCNVIEEINTKVDTIKNFVKNKDYQESYEILREVYIIHPSFHELWFFGGHFNHFTGRGGLLTGRLGLKSYLTSLVRGTLERRIKGISTYVFKRTILVENLFSGVLDCSLFDFAPLDNKQMEAKIKDLTKLSSLSPPDIILKMQDVFEITRTLLENTEYDALKTDKLLESDKWLYYAPCDINEGPIFKKITEKSRIDILKKINSIDQNEIRSELSNHFEITPILRV